MALFRKTRRKSRKRPSEALRSKRAADPERKRSVTEAERTDSENAELPAVSETGKAVQEDLPARVSADNVFKFFREISAIPRGSGHTEAISDHLMAFARERGLACCRDDSFNVIIVKEASKGCEDAEPIALQGHIDMVLASRPDKEIDMLREPVTILEEGGWMYADGTTLGADNGIAVSMMMAVLDDDSVKHPYLECIFTSDEEIGLVGASQIDLSQIRSRRLLNLDSETEGVFVAGCAGGSEVLCRMEAEKKNRGGRCAVVGVSGLAGGHSGVDIALGRANGIRLLSRMLYRLYSSFPFRLVNINGGDANNAIPSHAAAKIQFAADVDTKKVLKLFESTSGELAEEFSFTDPKMKWNLDWEPAAREASVSKKTTAHILRYLMAVPTGVTHINAELSGSPRTSLNLGIVSFDDKAVRTEFMIRSGVNSQTKATEDRLICIAEGFGAKASVRASYPAWEYRENSPLRDMAVSTYRKLTGRDPAVEVIHAGLECGVFSGKLPGLDCISAGPDLENVHTANERMSISSAENLWNFVLALLEEAARKAE